jgi:tetratricopeptide (TPR) repeat protein
LTTLGEVLQQARGLLQSGQWAGAEALYRQLVQHVPQSGELWHELGVVLWQSDRPQEGAQYIERAIRLEPAVAAYHGNLGVVYRTLKRHDDAIASLKRALQLGPSTHELHNNLALALKDAGQYDAAVQAIDDALRLQPNYANGHFNRGNVLLDVGRLEEAIASYRRALALEPRDAGAYCKLGVAYYDLGQYDEALQAFDQSLQIQPHYPEVRRNRALVWLVRGESDRAWREFEWRLDCEGFNKRVFPQPAWDGSPLAGRTLLVHPEQGLGDTLQFVRYVPLVEEAGGRVVLEVQPALLPLLRTSGFERWLMPAGTSPQFDVHAPLMTLAGYLPDRSGQPVWRGEYLAADPVLVTQWRQRLAGLRGFKVGIVWAGNPDHPHDRFRSIELAELAPLATLEGVQLISLQKGAGLKQLRSLSAKMNILDLGDDLDERTGAFMDSAAVMKSLDLVIAVDTSLAHLAGGLGVPVWVPLQLSPDWRWLTGRATTPWYPSMRLFRQRVFNVWPPVVAEMATELRSLAAS